MTDKPSECAKPLMRPADTSNRVLALAAVVSRLALHYRVKELSPVEYELYERGLADISPYALQEAADKAMRECKRMPTVADLRKCVPHEEFISTAPAWYREIGEPPLGKEEREELARESRAYLKERRMV